MSLPTVDKIWMDGELVDWDKAQVHVLTHALHYGSGVFEGIRCYETADGPAVFRLTEHMERFERIGQDALHGPRLLGRRDGRGGQGDDPRQQAAGVLHPPDRVSRLRRHGSRPDSRARQRHDRRAGRGRRTWARRPCARASTSASARGASAASTRCRRRSRPPATTSTRSFARIEANQHGYNEAILLNEEGKVCEGTGENIFIVRDGVISTPPVSDGLLEGITRDSIMQHRRRPGLRRDRGVARAHRPLHRRRDVHDRLGGRGRAGALGRPPRRSARPVPSRSTCRRRSSASFTARSRTTTSGSSACSPTGRGFPAASSE